MLYPKIGIRPVIDGRWGGVRESVEGKTISMARAAAELIGTLKYPDGTPVQTVISRTTIGGGAEAAACAEQFALENVTATLTVTPVWCYGMETFDMDKNTIKAVWGFNGTERPGAVYLAAVMAAYAEKGLPAFSIYGHDVQDASDNSIPDDVKKKLLDFARCAVVVGWMRNKSYVNLGGIAMGIAGSYCDMNMFSKYFGIRAEWVDLTEILRRMTLNIYDESEYQKALAWIHDNCREGMDINAGKALTDIVLRSKVVPKDKDWEFIAKMSVIIRDILYGNKKLDELGWHEEALGKNAVAAGFQGQRNWTDWLPNADFTEAVMASTFDWNGKRQPTPFATENDTLNGVAMMLATLLTGRAPCFHDVRTFWSADAVERVSGMRPTGRAENGFIHLINSGATALDMTGACRDENGEPVMKRWWEMTERDISACLNATDWCRANYEYFRGGGFSSHFRTEAEMPVTMLRVNIIDGIGPVLQLAEGYTVTLPDKMHEILDKRTDPTWPTTWFVPKLTGEGAFADVYSVMAAWGANHGVTVYGHIGAELITLASMLRIPINMHNVAPERVFRPHSWAAFGTGDAMAADFAACEKYGPIYG
ncbi:MAG: L-fucose isomerase [Eubacteriales bacterium]|nr:L-fucose isomerase [Eubacteriales bacterium]MDD3880711.1 L-fucose isomerase [Eubacteriales bacterium]MDD4511655.1 L-fucose isomerase [Eubacteriales bacterium]